VLPGLAILGSRAGRADDEITDWLKKII